MLSVVPGTAPRGLTDRAKRTLEPDPALKELSRVTGQMAGQWQSELPNSGERKRKLLRCRSWDYRTLVPRSHRIAFVVPQTKRFYWQRFPEDSSVRFNYLPTIRVSWRSIGQSLRRRWNSSSSLNLMNWASPLVVSQACLGALYPIYVRGQAYLAANRGTEAAAAFQKIVDHRGIVVSDPIGALAHLQLGGAYALAGDIARAKSAYQDFFMFWKDADPDIPILTQAKAEYVRCDKEGVYVPFGAVADLIDTLGSSDEQR